MAPTYHDIHRAGARDAQGNREAVVRVIASQPAFPARQTISRPQARMVSADLILSMWARSGWKLTGTLLAVLACSGPNPAYRVDLNDGSTPPDRDGDSTPSDGVTMDSGAPPTDTMLPLPKDSGGPGLDAQVPGDAVTADRPPPDTLTADVAMPDVVQDAPAADAPSNPVDAPVPRGTGLLGSYFDGSQLEGGTPGTLDMQRFDAVINFEWPRNTGPDPCIDDDYFSVRWTGEIMPATTGTYTFTTITDDGVRLFVNDVMIIDAWTVSGASTNSGSTPTPLTGNQRYKIRLEYREATQDAMAKLYWTPPGQARQIVPQERLFPAVPTLLGCRIR